MTSHPRRITRALLSVSDKTGLVDFATALAGYGVELVSTGGTAKALKDAGLKVIDVAELTGFPEMMDGRVKTLHPKVHGGLLAIRANKEHAASMEKHGIKPIDLLVVNLYPFEATVAKGAAFDDCIENIDIGGPAMIRAAAKNHADVTVVVEPADYEKVLGELAQHNGMTTLELRQKLAAKAYARTAAYDAAISNWFAETLHDNAPDYRAFGGKLAEALRYGENPHQSAAFYRAPGERFGVASARQLQGKELSYNNINDTDAAYECVAEFDPRRTAGLRDRQARQPLRRGGRRQPARRLRQGAGLRSDFGLRRHRRAQPQARRRCGAGDHRDFHRGDHRAGRQRRGDQDRRCEKEPAAAAGRRPARSARARIDGEVGGRRPAGAVARQRGGGRDARLKSSPSARRARRNWPICALPSASPST